MKLHMDLSSLPAGVLVILGLVLLAELALAVFALVDLVRRPRQRVVFGNKWVWVAIIVLVNLVGPILYLAVGRKPGPPVDETPPVAAGGTSMTSVADALYGEPGDEDPR
jgi:hypothetical protein